jgi:predicted nucleic acid-binding protein
MAGKADVLVTGDSALLEAARSLPLPVVNPRGLWDRLRASKPRR